MRTLVATLIALTAVIAPTAGADEVDKKPVPTVSATPTPIMTTQTHCVGC